MKLRTIKRRHIAKGPHNPFVKIVVWAAEQNAKRNRAKRRGEPYTKTFGGGLGTVSNFRFIASPML